VRRKLVWGLPIRIFHWVLVLLVCISLYTGLSGGFIEMDYHMLSGYGVLTLILFRFVWGLTAKGNARFSNFIFGPATISRFIKGNHKSKSGHNPLGALSVVAMLVALLLQASTGLFANDDVLLEGPLAHLVSYDTSRALTAIHKLNMWFVFFLLGLHLTAQMYYELVRKERLVLPMITGTKLLPDNNDYEEEKHQLFLALPLMLMCSGVIYYLVTYV